MPNYRISPDSYRITTTGAASNGEDVFPEFSEAKAALLRSLNEEIARLKLQRKQVRALMPRSALPEQQ